MFCSLGAHSGVHAGDEFDDFSSPDDLHDCVAVVRRHFLLLLVDLFSLPLPLLDQPLEGGRK